MGTLFRPDFVFTSDQLSDITKKCLIKDFVRLRDIACNKLNPHYEEWNDEFNNILTKTVDPDDPLADYGGTEYCEFIRSKQMEIIEKINKRYAKRYIKLDTDLNGGCDIIGVAIKNPKLKMHLVLYPID